MSLLTLTITGRTPSKKNHTIVSCRGKYPVHFPSNDYRKWHAQALPQVAQQTRMRGINLCNTVSITFFFDSMHKSDLTNKAESIMDLLVDSGVLTDDNWFVVPRVTLRFGGVDRVNPRAEVSIE